MQRTICMMTAMLSMAVLTTCSSSQPGPTLTPTFIATGSSAPNPASTRIATAPPTLEESNPPLPLPTNTKVVTSSEAALLLRDASNQITPPNTSQGNYILFVSDRDGTAEIYRMKPDGSEQVRLTKDKRNNFSPAWSPNGQQIAFISEEINTQTDAITSHLHLMNWDSTKSVDLTPHLALSVSSMTWSPDGRQIAFVARPGKDDPFSGSNIFIVDVDGSRLTQLTDASEGSIGCWSPTWSPDSTQLVYLCRGLMQVAIFIADARGSNRWSLDLGQVNGIFWLPSGENIAFTGGICAIGIIETEFMVSRGEVKPRSPWPCLDADLDALNAVLRSPFEVVWSPVEETRFMIRTKGIIQIVDIDRSVVTVVEHAFNELNRVASSASWSPDGRYIAFASDSGDGVEIYRLVLGGDQVARLTYSNATNSMPAWQP